MESVILCLLITLAFVFLICFIFAKKQQTRSKERENQSTVSGSNNHMMDFEKYYNRYSICKNIGEVDAEV